jgi:hypothetical protein
MEQRRKVPVFFPKQLMESSLVGFPGRVELDTQIAPTIPFVCFVGLRWGLLQLFSSKWVVSPVERAERTHMSLCGTKHFAGVVLDGGRSTESVGSWRVCSGLGNGVTSCGGEPPAAP